MLERDEEFVLDIRPDDVLLGRGFPTPPTAGSVRFRELIKRRKQDYVSTNQHRAKAEIAQEIVKAIHNEGGRFVIRVIDPKILARFDETAVVYRIVEEKFVLPKVKQALRDIRSYKDEPPKSKQAILASRQAQLSSGELLPEHEPVGFSTHITPDLQAFLRSAAHAPLIRNDTPEQLSRIGASNITLGPNLADATLDIPHAVLQSLLNPIGLTGANQLDEETVHPPLFNHFQAIRSHGKADTNMPLRESPCWEESISSVQIPISQAASPTMSFEPMSLTEISKQMCHEQMLSTVQNMLDLPPISTNPTPEEQMKVLKAEEELLRNLLVEQQLDIDRQVPLYFVRSIQQQLVENSNTISPDTIQQTARIPPDLRQVQSFTLHLPLAKKQGQERASSPQPLAKALSLPIGPPTLPNSPMNSCSRILQRIG